MRQVTGCRNRSGCARQSGTPPPGRSDALHPARPAATRKWEYKRGIAAAAGNPPRPCAEVCIGKLTHLSATGLHCAYDIRCCGSAIISSSSGALLEAGVSRPTSALLMVSSHCVIRASRREYDFPFSMTLSTVKPEQSQQPLTSSGCFPDTRPAHHRSDTATRAADIQHNQPDMLFRFRCGQAHSAAQTADQVYHADAAVKSICTTVL